MAATGGAQAAEPVVATRAGPVRGLAEDGVWTFRGIPYGAPTGGVHRFRPPRPAPPWTDVRDATRWGERAPQLSQAGQLARELVGDREAARRLEPSGEDCLVLNVYAPAPIGGGRLPVMVWLHGGGYASGSGGPGYEAQELAREQDVVVVTINHRLNVFGFLDLSAFGRVYRDSAGCGLLDAILALRWVKANVAAFGGDAGNVTNFGQSGGGAKVSTLMASPLARGLFHKAIAQSGAVTTALTESQAQSLSRDLLARLGFTGPDAPSRLQAAAADDLLQAMAAIGATGNPAATRDNFGPVAGSRLLPRQPAAPESLAVSGRIPLMVGWTLQETRAFFGQGLDTMTPAGARAAFATVLHTTPERAAHAIDSLAPLRPGFTPGEVYIDATTLAMFGRPSWMTAGRRAGLPAPTWLYRWDWRRPGPDGARLGAAHGLEVRLLFGRTAPDESAETRAMRNLVRTIWGTFARTGRPGAPGLPAWPPYGSGAQTMVLNTASRMGVAPEPAIAAWAADLVDFHP